MKLNQLRDNVHENAVKHGWWDKEKSFGDFIALCHSKLSEALEEYRNLQYDTYWKCPKCKSHIYQDQLYLLKHHLVCCKEPMKPEGIPIELADTIIRILDFCGEEGIDIEKAIDIKHKYNETRPYRHGGKNI